MALSASPVPTYHNTTVTPQGLGAVNVNYIEAGNPSLPTFVLLHGFPSSSNQFRDLIPLLSDSYHVLAPDFPGFGLTTVEHHDFKYTFDNLTAVIQAWLLALNVTSYAVYIFDYGAPVGLRLAVNNPDQVKAIVSQNGNAYNSGFGHPFWDPIEKLWTTGSSQDDRDWLRDIYLTLGATRMQYYTGVPDGDRGLVNPLACSVDYSMNEAGHVNQEHQLDLFKDYGTNLPFYPTVHKYFREHQPPLLAVWGKGDPIFVPPGAEAFKTDLPNAEVHHLDAGHFALETKRVEIAGLIRAFLSKVEWC